MQNGLFGHKLSESLSRYQSLYFTPKLHYLNSKLLVFIFLHLPAFIPVYNTKDMQKICSHEIPAVFQ